MKQYLDLRKSNQIYLDAFMADLQQIVAENSYILGPGVEDFDREYALYIGTKYCIGTANCTDALFIILKCLGIGQGDSVLAQAYTCDATWAAIYQTGARPLPVDVFYETLNFNPTCLPANPDKSVKALVLVHMNGAPADVEAAQAYCERHNLYLIEDNAQATGASFKGKLTGSFGIAAAHSFYPTKPLGGLGDGGAITTNDESLANKCRVFANYGRTPGSWDIPQSPGINSRLDELQARFLLRKLPFIEEHIADRAHQAEMYRDILAAWGVQFQEFIPGTTSAHHLCTILHPEREQIRAHLAKLGIETKVHYPYAPHQIPTYGYADGAAPIAAKIARETLTLPL